MEVLPAPTPGRKHALVFDTETYRIEPGIAAPRLVCLSYATLDEKQTGLLLRDEAVEFMRRHLARTDVRWVGQNIAFDFIVLAAVDITLLPDIMRAYDENRVIDVRVRDKLLKLAVGELADERETGAKRQAKFTLDQMVLRRFGDTLTEHQKERLIKDKKDPKSWRLRYRELDGVPLDQWPAEAKEYAIDDALWTGRILQHQTKEQLANTGGKTAVVPDEFAQNRAALWLALARTWGVRTDARKVSTLSDKLSARLLEIDHILKKAGILKGKHSKGRVRWSKDMKRLRSFVKAAYGEKFSESQLTESGQVATDRDTLLQVPLPHQPGCVLTREIEGRHEEGKCTDDCLVGILHAVSDRNTVEKVLSTYVPALMAGTLLPICPNWNELVASGRTSCYDPNFQNPPRKGEVRECVVPRPGYVFVSADYSFLELCTLAQVCLGLIGWSTLAEAINNDIDPHLDMAADLLGISYEEAVARKEEPLIQEYRQMSKAANFGLPGGLGAEKFVLYARDSYGVVIDIDKSRQLKRDWQTKWPEMVQYHNKIKGWVRNESETFTLTQVSSYRKRGGCGFTDGSNSFFQGLAADGGKHAGWLVAKECYLEDPYRNGAGPTALHGSRIVLFLHDEFILEVPEQRAAEAAERLVAVMEAGMKEFVPDVKVKAEPALMRRWYKAAKPVYSGNRLVAWEPKGLLPGPVGVAA